MKSRVSSCHSISSLVVVKNFVYKGTHFIFLIVFDCYKGMTKNEYQYVKTWSHKYVIYSTLSFKIFTLFLCYVYLEDNKKRVWGWSVNKDEILWTKGKTFDNISYHQTLFLKFLKSSN